MFEWRPKLIKAKEQLRHYLLGNLSSDDRVALEAQLLFSEELHQELMIIEQELVDEYVAGELSPGDRKGFEAHFLEDAFRKEQLRFGESFNNYLLDTAVVELPGTTGVVPMPIPGTTVPSASASPFSSFSNRMTLLGAAAAVVLAIVMTGAYLKVAHKPPAQPIEKIVVALESGSMRAEGALQRVQAPPPNAEVRLELKVPSAKYKTYKAELFKEQQSVDLHDGLTAEAQGDEAVVPVVVEAEILEPGDYQVKLSGSLEPSQEEAVGTYAFRVLTR